MLANPPLFSEFTLFTELLVTYFVLYIFYTGYTKGIFLTKLAFFTLAYETLFNISYMSYRALTHEAQVGPHTHTPIHIAIAAFHGTFSIIMFVALIVFLLIAWRKYKAGINFFRSHKIISFTFIVLWLTAISSGILFYYVAYFTNT